MVEVVYEDNHVLVLNKPAGILTQPDGSDCLSLEELGKEYLQRPYLHALHRLDKPVSGLVLFAKTSKALSRLNAAMREGKFEKIYSARVDQPPKNPDGELVHYLLRDEAGTRVVAKGTPEAKEARLHYRLIKENLLEIRLITGRRHQIRVQLAAIGCPIVGDKKYGSRTDRENIALAATSLAFPHPTKGNSIKCEIPAALE